MAVMSLCQTQTSQKCGLRGFLKLLYCLPLSDGAGYLVCAGYLSIMAADQSSEKEVLEAESPGMASDLNRSDLDPIYIGGLPASRPIRWVYRCVSLPWLHSHSPGDLKTFFIRHHGERLSSVRTRLGSRRQRGGDVSEDTWDHASLKSLIGWHTSLSAIS